MSLVFIELGTAIIAMAILARLASRWGLSAIPLYLLSGLAVGNGGIAPLNLSKSFIEVGAEIGVLLLLFMLGIEYSGEELKENLRRGWIGGIIDLLLNFPVGMIAGLLLGWSLLPSILLGGVTFISSSGIVARILSELGRLNAQETPTILSVLVLEDLDMAIYLPLVAVLIAGGGPHKVLLSVSVAVATVVIVLFVAIRYGKVLSRFAAHESDEVILLTTFGTVLLIAGVAEELQVSAAIGAFLVGIAVSGPIKEQAHRMLTPLRDLFAAIFFFFFGLETNPRSLSSVALTALAIAVVSIVTKLLTGILAAKATNLETHVGVRAGITLVARGEFSIVIAGLGANLEPRLGPLAAAYVILLAVLSPILVHLIPSQDIKNRTTSTIQTPFS
jgi:monovalent cation:H+ antiporter-2, CPA2 family